MKKGHKCHEKGREFEQAVRMLKFYHSLGSNLNHFFPKYCIKDVKRIENWIRARNM